MNFNTRCNGDSLKCSNLNETENRDAIFLYIRRRRRIYGEWIRRFHSELPIEFDWRRDVNRQSDLSLNQRSLCSSSTTGQSSPKLIISRAIRPNLWISSRDSKKMIDHFPSNVGPGGVGDRYQTFNSFSWSLSPPKVLKNSVVLNESIRRFKDWIIGKTVNSWFEDAQSTDPCLLGRSCWPINVQWVSSGRPRQSSWRDQDWQFEGDLASNWQPASRCNRNSLGATLGNSLTNWSSMVEPKPMWSILSPKNRSGCNWGPESRTVESWLWRKRANNRFDSDSFIFNPRQDRWEM